MYYIPPRKKKQQTLSARFSSTQRAENPCPRSTLPVSPLRNKTRQVTFLLSSHIGRCWDSAAWQIVPQSEPESRSGQGDRRLWADRHRCRAPPAARAGMCRRRGEERRSTACSGVSGAVPVTPASAAQFWTGRLRHSADASSQHITQMGTPSELQPLAGGRSEVF